MGISFAGFNSWSWFFAILGAVVAASSFECSTYAGLTNVAVAIMVINIGLLIALVPVAFRNQQFGQIIMLAGFFVYFHMEIAGAALAPLPFTVGALMPLLPGQYPIDDLQAGLFYVSLFQLMAMVGYSIRPKLRGMCDWISSHPDSTISPGDAALIVLSAFSWIQEFVAFKTLPAVLAFLQAGKQSWIDDAPGIVRWNRYIATVAIDVILVRCVLKKKPVRFMGPRMGLAFAFLMAVPILARGNRSWDVFLFIPPLIAFMHQRWQRARFGAILKVSLICLAIVLFMRVQYYVRNTGWSAIINGQVDDAVVDSFGSEQTFLLQFDSLLFAVDQFPHKHPFFHEFAEPYFLEFWIPRAVWPEKPYGTASWIYYNATYTGDMLGSTNVTPSIVGQYYMNFGVFGVIGGGLWFGLLFAVADRLNVAVSPRSHSVMLVIVGMFYGFLIAAFRIYDPSYFAYTVLAIPISFMFVKSSDRCRRAAVPASQDLLRVSGIR